MIHGHFLGMGGLTLVDQHLRDSHPETQSNSARVLTPEELEGRLNNPDFQRSLTRITNDETEDRFKSDALSKIIAILQLMWFIIHCIARSQQGLALTELELVTVALASLNFVTYGIWWDKPLDVKEPVRILWTIDTEPVVPTSQATDDLQEVRVLILERFQEPTKDSFDPCQLSATCVLFEAWKVLKESASALYRPCLYVEEFLFYMFIILPLNVFYIVTFPLYVLFPWGIVLLLKIIETEEVNGDNSNLRIAAQMLATLQGWRHNISLLIRKPFQRRFKDSFLERGSTFFWSWFLLFPTMFILLLLFCVLFVPFSLSVSCFSFVSQSVFSIISTSTVHPHAAHVPTFYAPKTESDKFSRMVVFALSGVIFNGLNLLGWKLIYPTSIERTIWRATSLAITTIPFAVAPIDCLLENAEAPFPKYLLALDGRFGKRARYGLDFIMTILLFIYVPARLFLVAQAFALLRDQPTKALLIVDWTKYIPHLFS